MHSPDAANAAGFRLRFGGGPFRSGCDSLGAHLRPPLHFPRSPTADRSHHLNPVSGGREIRQFFRIRCWHSAANSIRGKARHSVAVTKISQFWLPLRSNETAGPNRISILRCTGAHRATPIRRDQRAFCFTNRALVTSGHSRGPQERRPAVCGSAKPTADRSQSFPVANRLTTPSISD